MARVVRGLNFIRMPRLCLAVGALLPFALHAQQGSSKLNTVSAATFKQQSFARGMIVSSFGDRLATSTASAARTPLPNILAGTTVKLVDSRNVEGYAGIFFVSPTQVNWLVPDWPTDGPLNLTIASAAGVVSTGTIQIGKVAPGLFTANANGTGVPAAMAVALSADGSQTVLPVADCGTAPGSCIPLHLDVAGPTDLILLLFGTGMRGYSTISAHLAGQRLEVLGAQAQSQYPGLDQVNVRLPRALSGSGDLQLVITVDGQESNAVTIAIGPAPHRITAISPESAMAGRSIPSFTVRGESLGNTVGIHFYPPEGITVTNLAVSADAVSAQLVIASSALVGARRVCVFSATGRSNCLHFAVLPGIQAPAEMTDPPPGARLVGSTVTFRWTAGSGVDQYYLAVGSSLGAHDLCHADQANRQQAVVSGLPVDG